MIRTLLRTDLTWRQKIVGDETSSAGKMAIALAVLVVLTGIAILVTHP